MSFRAQDTSTGQRVLLHQIRPERAAPHMPDLTALVFKYLTGAVAPGTHQFVEIGQDEDRLFVVTADVPECEDLRLWLEYLDASQKARQASLAPVSPSAPDLDFEVTQVVAEVSLDPAPPAAAVDIGEVPLAPASAAAPAAFAGPAPKKFGDRRQQFFGKDRPGAQPGPPASPAGAGSKLEVNPPGKTPRGQVPSGFEVVFQSRKQTPGTSSPPAPPPKTGPSIRSGAPNSGQFTQLFSELGKHGTEPPAAQMPSLRGHLPAAPPVSGPKQSDVLMGGKGAGGQPDTPLAPGVGRPVSMPPPQSKPDKPGEFTQMFLRGSKSPPAQSPPSPPASASGPPDSPPSPPTTAKTEPDEATLMFQSPATKNTLPDAPAPPAPPASAPGVQGASPLGGASEGPGEFTRLFHRGTPPATPHPVGTGPATRPAAPVTGPPAGPDELTTLMEGYRPPSQTPAVPAALEAPPPPPAPEPARKGPGEYSKPLQPPPARVPLPPGPPAAPASQPPGAYTSMFEAPTVAAAPPARVVPPGPPAGSARASVSRPGAPPLPAAPTLLEPPYVAYHKAAPAAAKKSALFFWLLISGLGGLFLLAAAVVLFFALKH
jgi:hypothetical protein